MVNAQKWLNEQFPSLESRVQTKRIDKEFVTGTFAESLFPYQRKLEGELDLSDFVNLEYLDPYVSEGIIVKGLEKLEKMKLNMITLQEQFEKDHPDKRVKKLFANANYIRKNFTNYDLDLGEYVELELLNVNNNKLQSANFLNTIPNPEKLKELVIFNNHIQPTNIEIFSRFVNLEKLSIGAMHFERRNRFYGSLKSFQNLTKLEKICIEATDVNEGLEYLPESLVRAKATQEGHSSHFECLPRCGTGAEVKKIQDQLRPFNYDLESWQLAHPEKMLISKPELFTQPESKDKWIKALNKKLTESHQLLVQTKEQEADKLSKIARLEAKVQELELAKTNISQQTQTEFTTQNKGTQTDLTAEQITKLEKDNQTLKKLLQAIEQELTNTKNQLTQLTTQSATNQEQINQLQSKIKLLEQQKTNYQTKYDNSIAFIKEIREDIAKS